MSRNYNTEYWKTLYESISCSVVQLSVCKKERGKFVPKQFGTGIVLCDAPGCVAVLTTVTCEYEEDDKKSGGKKIVKDHVFVQLGDSERRAHIYASGSIVNILLLPITDPYKNKFVLLDDESFYETDIYKSEPVWVAGCFSESLKQVMPSGYVSACDAEKLVHGEIVQTFVHSCPIGDGLIGAPIVNRFCKIIGVNIAPTSKTAKLNHAVKLEGLRIDLAWLLDESDNKKPMSSLVAMLKKGVVNYLRAMRSKRQKTDGASSSSATAN